MPSSLEDSATAEALDVVLELRGHVEDLQAVEFLRPGLMALINER